MAVSGTTRVAGLFGFPARHSLSPALHAAAYASLGIDATYVVFPVTSEHLADAVRGITAMDFMGVSITMPHKHAVVPLLNHVSDVATKLQAVNTIVPVNDTLTGDNTDGAGFIASLRIDNGFEPHNKRCVVLGAGGAARSVALGLVNAGALDVSIIARNPSKGNEAAMMVGVPARVGTLGDIGEADIVVNATPVGMDSHPGLPSDPALLAPHTLVADLIYAPSTTAYLAEAQRRGCATMNGLGMLVHQAAQQVYLWTGQHPDTNIMRAALSPQ